MIPKISNALLSMLLLGEVAAFSPSKMSIRNQHFDSQLLMSVEDLGTPSRRKFMDKSLSILSTSMAIVAGASPAFADVSEGNALPQGAAQFSRVIRAKADLQGVQKRVREGASEMDKTEWNNVGAFLRRVYGVSEDMKAIATGFYEPEKKKKASELIVDLKKFSKAADVPTGTQNAQQFLAYAQKLSSILDEFLDLLSDVPDEI